MRVRCSLWGPTIKNRFMLVYDQNSDSSLCTLWSDGTTFSFRASEGGWTREEMRKYQELRDERSVAAIESQKRGTRNDR